MECVVLYDVLQSKLYVPENGQEKSFTGLEQVIVYNGCVLALTHGILYLDCLRDEEKILRSEVNGFGAMDQFGGVLFVAEGRRIGIWKDSAMQWSKEVELLPQDYIIRLKAINVNEVVVSTFYGEVFFWDHRCDDLIFWNVFQGAVGRISKSSANKSVTALSISNDWFGFGGVNPYCTVWNRKMNKCGIVLKSNFVVDDLLINQHHVVIGGDCNSVLNYKITGQLEWKIETPYSRVLSILSHQNNYIFSGNENYLAESNGMKITNKYALYPNKTSP